MSCIVFCICFSPLNKVICIKVKGLSKIYVHTHTYILYIYIYIHTYIYLACVYFDAELSLKSVLQRKRF